MRIYLDTCCYNRPFDDNTQMNINLEAISVLYIQEKVKEGLYELVWSFILDYENNINPSTDNRHNIQNWENHSNHFCQLSGLILKKAENIEKYGIHQRDALHIACALSCECEFFITTDYNLLKKGKGFKKLKIINPIDFIREEKNNEI